MSYNYDLFPQVKENKEEINKRNVEVLMGFLLGKANKAKKESEKKNFLDAFLLVKNKILPGVSDNRDEEQAWDILFDNCCNTIKYKKAPDGRKIPDVNSFKDLDFDVCRKAEGNRCYVLKLKITNKKNKHSEEIYLAHDQEDFDFEEDGKDIIKVFFEQSFSTFTWRSYDFKLKDPEIANDKSLFITGLISTKTADPTNDSKDYDIISYDDPDLEEDLEIEVIDGLDGEISNPYYYYNMHPEEYLFLLSRYGKAGITDDVTYVMEEPDLIGNYIDGVEGNDIDIYGYYAEEYA